ncbi:SMP-30/gluconolactonase/LRE family protein [Gordonia sp. DT30]|uniref:SMP-30/gluconolactonase/LRE family protein n=1 Tax=Gordonia sp. DT30 TaxID=3416546 RepID=UPI003CED4E19
MLAAALGGWTASARAEAASCPVVHAETLVPGSGVDGWAENVLVTDGSIWVSRTFGDVVERYDASGRRTESIAVRAPGSIRQGPDGLLYVTSGDTTANMIPGAPRTGSVVRFDPQSRAPIARTFAAGLGMPNGLAIDAHGAVYVADGALGVLRLRPDGHIDEPWSSRAPKNLAPTATVNGTSANGLVAVGDDLYLTMTTSLTGRVLRVPIANPAAVTPAADLTAPLPGILDDLVALDDTTLAVASTTGQLHFVNLRSRQVCSSTVGVPLSALAAVPGQRDTVVATSENGQIMRLRWS